MKNKELILFNLQDAVDQLNEIIDSIHNDSDYTEIEFKIDHEHAYHHMNYAWNIQHATEAEIQESSKENYKKWSRFPINEILEYE